MREEGAAADGVNMVPGNAPWLRNVTTVTGGYSLAERDRRWGAVQAGAQTARLDGILVPLGNDVDARYLTQLRNAVVVLRAGVEEPIVVAPRGASNQWVPDPRSSGRDWAAATIAAVREARLERGTIGVAGLRGGAWAHVRYPEGVVNYGAFAELRRQLPDATFVDATDVVGSVRAVKSPEEIAALRKAVAIADAGIDALAAVARPGRDVVGVYAGIHERMLALGSAHADVRLSVNGAAGDSSTSASGPPLANGDLLDLDVGPVWQGERCHERQPVAVGSVPATWRPAITALSELFARCEEKVQPGVAFGELLEVASSFRPEPGLSATIHLNGLGYGADGPLITPDYESPGARALRAQAGNAVAITATIDAPHGQRFSWGSSLVIATGGTERLSVRPCALRSLV